MNWRPLAVEIICVLFVFLFVYAAVNKLLDVQKFTAQIGQSPLLTSFGWIAWFIPLIEIIISIALCFRLTRVIALYASFSLMTIFSAYIVSILNFSYYVPCSCGGILEMLGWKEHLIFNLVFVLLAAFGILAVADQGRRAESQTSIR
jgi:uncharacterized membrane protein YphA (DoxX/SURF4 family)